MSDDNRYKQLKDSELIQHLANAATTGALCGGHGKAWANRAIQAKLREEAARRGLKLPEMDVLYKMGVFNGEGST